VFATPEAADEWFKDNDPEGVAFGYEVLGRCTYGVFFKNNDYVGARMSIMIDSCEKQAFTPFRYGPLSTVR